MPPPPPPRAAAFGWRHLFQLRPSPPRLQIALRAALCMGTPVAAGWFAGDVPAGLMATIGAFTVLYGADRPYANRAILLATVAAAFTAVVVIGVETHPVPLIAILAVVLISAVATFLCNALRTGPPGAYLFALACAAATAVPTGHLALWQIGSLVLAGAAFSWCVQLSGMLLDPRGPERTAVVNSAAAVARFAEAIGTPSENETRHLTAMTLHNTWTMLVGFQPGRSKPDNALDSLRSINRELHLLFADTINAARSGATLNKVAEQAKALAAEAKLKHLHRGGYESAGALPLGHYGIRKSLRESLTLSSPALLAAFRVAAATAIAGTLGLTFGLERAYWIMAAAVLVLHQGLDWTRSLQRGLERTIGTLVGLIVAGLVLSAGPQGLVLAFTLAALQFLIEILVIRNYALAVVFITAAALVIASGGQMVADVGHLLWVRGIDTIAGCSIGLVVHLLTAPRNLAVPIPEKIVDTLASVETVLGFIAASDVRTLDAKQARRDLQVRASELLTTYETGIGATARDRNFAERMWPAVLATQRLAYHLLATCWTIEEAGGDRSKAAASTLDDAGLIAAKQGLAAISDAVRSGGMPAPLPALPELVAADLEALNHSLVEAEG